MTISTSRPRERLYLISCLEQNSGHYIFFAVDDFSKMLFSLGTFESVSDKIYEEVIINFTKDRTFNQHTGPFTFIAGFGKEVCEGLKNSISKLEGDIIYNPKEAIDNAWETIVNAFTGNLTFNLKPVYASVTKISTWTRYLDVEFIRKFLPDFKDLPEAAQGLIQDFKTQFPAGIDHASFVDAKAAEQIIKRQDYQNFIMALLNVPSHNGIYYVDIGNGQFSDFVYRFTNVDGWVNIVCFREQGNIEGVVVGSFATKGSMELRTPSGMSDLLISAKLIAMGNSKQELLHGIKINYNPDGAGANRLDPKRAVISIEKFLYMTYQL